MKRIAILYICTGKYRVLWKEFFESFEEKFLPSCPKDYFVFTDADFIEYEKENNRIHRIYQEAMPWPLGTLLRFQMFNRIIDDLATYDYVFFFNANAFAVQKITNEMILPCEEKKESLCFVKHPAYRNCKPFEFPYDRNFRCKAYIPYGKGKVYVQGCLIGGTAEAFLDLSQTISDQIDYDLKRNVIALWHDESYLNKYALKHRKRFRLLGIEFANPVSDNPEDCVIHMRPKQKYFDVDSVKNEPPKSELSKINAVINTKIFGILDRKRVFVYDYKTLKKEHGLLQALGWRLKNHWRVYFGKE